MLWNCMQVVTGSKFNVTTSFVRLSRFFSPFREVPWDGTSNRPRTLLLEFFPVLHSPMFHPLKLYSPEPPPLWDYLGFLVPLWKCLEMVLRIDHDHFFSSSSQFFIRQCFIHWSYIIWVAIDVITQTAEKTGKISCFTLWRQGLN